MGIAADPSFGRFTKVMLISVKDLVMADSIARIQFARINSTFSVQNLDHLKALEISSYNKWIDPVGTSWLRAEFKAPVLTYSEQLLHRDGFIGTKILIHLGERENELYGIYGPPKKWGELRCHLAYPCRFALHYQLIILDWEILEWHETKTKI
jgi:hypothetical protein